ncbi:MAG: CoA-binding protein, partial [Candidatus Latescibacteria bacterium]|nr:CoA-binding protein [Candidatus Latescibacterota bacterium]
MSNQHEESVSTRPLQGMFAPRAIAVIGASAKEGTVGQSVFQNLLFNRYTGTIYPINPKYKSLLGVRCYSDVKSIGDPEVDLAMIIIPAPVVPGVLRDCGTAGIRNAVVISAGFKEVGGEGVKLEEEAKGVAREMGISLLGPNCLGIINTDPAVSMNASFARTMPQRGNIGFISQSGALCTAILDYARGNNIGFSKFISFGNKADINENDLLCFLADDPQTDVILMYIEDLTDGRRFIKIAREITGERHPSKPILAIKTGRTLEGAGAAASHTGSLAGTDEVYDAILAQSGVLRVETVEDLFDYAMAFANRPLPKDNRVAIVTNAGGPGIMTTDACVRYGLRLSQLTSETVEKLKTKLPPTANFHNPIDVIGDAQSDRYRVALEGVLADEGVDGVIVILTPQNMTDIEAIAGVVWETSQHFPKPVIASFMGLYDVSQGVKVLREHGIPHYPFPESAARSLAAMYRYTQWTHRPRTVERQFTVDQDRVKAIINRAIEGRRRNLPEIEAMEVLKAYGFPTLRSSLVRTGEDAVKYAEEIGYPVVLKIVSPDILHK